MFKLTLVLALVAATATATLPYSPSLAFSALYYCKSAYCNDASIADWSCNTCGFHPGMAYVRVFNNASIESQAFVGYDANAARVVVAFRGSANIPNWINDLDFTKIDYNNPACPGCKIHKGFWGEWLSLVNGVMSHTAALHSMFPSAPLLVTGHSLGAAVSVIAGIEIVRRISPDVTIYNFGEPRVGDKAFAAYAHTVLPAERQFRVTHRRDPVPHLPPMSFGFMHTPHELWYDNEGNTSWTDCDDSGAAEDPHCSDSVIPIDIYDHLLYLGIKTECVMGNAPTPALDLRDIARLNARLAQLFPSQGIHTVKKRGPRSP